MPYKVYAKIIFYFINKEKMSSHLILSTSAAWVWILEGLKLGAE